MTELDARFQPGIFLCEARLTANLFDKILRRSGWNVVPQTEIVIPSSQSAVANAAKAIAICAYPQPTQLRIGGKAHKYAQALLAYIFRASQWVGELKHLPSWTKEIKAEAMWDRLSTGHERLIRSFVVRDLISSALAIQTQNYAAERGELSTFTIQYSADLKSVKIKIPVKQTETGVMLTGKILSKSRNSLREAVKRHRAALLPFAGPSPRIEGLDDEGFYQNSLNRLIRPTLQVSHIHQIVWEAANRYRKESDERSLPIDQILMRKANWADDMYRKANQNELTAILNMRELGIAGCSCKLVHLGPPLSDS